MRNYEFICYNCFSERPGAIPCPRCGFDETAVGQPDEALRRGTILHGRYMAGHVIRRGEEEIVYSGFDLTLESRLLLHEYAPVSTLREADGCAICFVDEAQAYDRRQEAKNFLERAKVILRGGKSQSGGPALIDLFEENNTAYYVTEYAETAAPSTAAAQGSYGTATYGTAGTGQTGYAGPTAYGAGQTGYAGQTTYGDPAGGAPAAGGSLFSNKKFLGILIAGIAAAAVAIILPVTLHSRSRGAAEAAAAQAAVEQQQQEQQQQQQQTAPAPTEAPEPTGTPEPTEAPTSDPWAAAKELTETFSSTRLSYTIRYPEGSEVEENNSYMDFITLGDKTRMIISYNYYADMPLYSVDNVLEDPERALAAVMGDQEYTYQGVYASDDGSMVEVDYHVTADDGNRDGWVVFVNSDNGPGVYELTAVYPEGGDAQMETLANMVISFDQTGDVQHGLRTIGGSEEGVRIFLQEADFAGDVVTTEQENDFPKTTVNVSVNGDGFITFRRFGNPAYGAEDWIGQMQTSLQENGYEITSSPYTVERNGYTFHCIDAVQQAGDQSHPVIVVAADDGSSVIQLTAEQVVHEDQREVADEVTEVLAWAMDTVEPVD